MKISRAIKRATVRQQKAAFSASDWESQGRLARAAGNRRDSAPEMALPRLAWLRGWDAEDQRIAAASIPPEEKARRWQEMEAFKERISKL